MPEIKKYIIVVAGGKGLRMGGDLPKQFVEVAGQPVLMRTLSTLHHAEPDAQIILALPLDHQAYWHRLCAEYSFAVPHQVVTGGETRFHSVRNALSVVPEDAEGVVAVHDGVRPFVAEDVVKRCMLIAGEKGAAIPVVGMVETVRRIESDGQTSCTVPRDAYRLVQTPQAFRISLLKQAYAQPYISAFTDDAGVVEMLGHRVELVEGNRENIKLTTPADLKYAEFLCRALT